MNSEYDYVYVFLQLLGNSQEEYDRSVFNYSIKNQLVYKGNLGKVSQIIVGQVFYSRIQIALTNFQNINFHFDMLLSLSNMKTCLKPIIKLQNYVEYPHSC